MLTGDSICCCISSSVLHQLVLRDRIWCDKHLKTLVNNFCDVRLWSNNKWVFREEWSNNNGSDKWNAEAKVKQHEFLSNTSNSEFNIESRRRNNLAALPTLHCTVLHFTNRKLSHEKARDWSGGCCLEWHNDVFTIVVYCGMFLCHSFVQRNWTRISLSTAHVWIKTDLLETDRQ